MSGFKIDIGNDQKMTIKQGVGEIKAGIRMGDDMSRISAYSGENTGLHTGADSPTVGRHNKPFGSK